VSEGGGGPGGGAYWDCPPPEFEKVYRSIDIDKVSQEKLSIKAWWFYAAQNVIHSFSRG